MYDFGAEELAALEALFKRGKLFRYNSNFDSECDLFEKEYSQDFQVNHSLILSSGTNALIAGLKSAANACRTSACPSRRTSTGRASRN